MTARGTGVIFRGHERIFTSGVVSSIVIRTLTTIRWMQTYPCKTLCCKLSEWILTMTAQALAYERRNSAWNHWLSLLAHQQHSGECIHIHISVTTPSGGFELSLPPVPKIASASTKPSARIFTASARALSYVRQNPVCTTLLWAYNCGIS